MNEWMNEWMNKRMNEQTNERTNKRHCQNPMWLMYAQTIILKRVELISNTNCHCCSTPRDHCTAKWWCFSNTMLNSSSYVNLVFISATDDVLVGHSKGVYTASSLALQHVHTLQGLQSPYLHTNDKVQRYKEVPNGICPPDQLRSGTPVHYFREHWA